jgi:hypothetical protein
VLLSTLKFLAALVYESCSLSPGDSIAAIASLMRSMLVELSRVEVWRVSVVLVFGGAFGRSGRSAVSYVNLPVCGDRPPPQNFKARTAHSAKSTLYRRSGYRGRGNYRRICHRLQSRQTGRNYSATSLLQALRRGLHLRRHAILLY